MTIPIKIECGCGQRYAFDVEPVNGRMASVVACPVCGADGTVAANAIIAGILQRPAVPSEPVLGLLAATQTADIQAASPAPAAFRAALLPGQLEPAKAEAEARAKSLLGRSA
jgi:hypothetical protein